MRSQQSTLVFAIIFGLLACATTAQEKRGPKISHKVFFDIEIDGKEAGELHFFHFDQNHLYFIFGSHHKCPYLLILLYNR